MGPDQLPATQPLGASAPPRRPTGSVMVLASDVCAGSDRASAPGEAPKLREEFVLDHDWTAPTSNPCLSDFPQPLRDRSVADARRDVVFVDVAKWRHNGFVDDVMPL